MGAGVPFSQRSTAAILGMSGLTASGSKTTFLPPWRCKTQHKQHVLSLLLKKENYFLGNASPSLKPGKYGEGSGLSPRLSIHLSSLFCIITCNLYTTLLKKH